MATFVSDILRADIAPVCCLSAKDVARCSRRGVCSTTKEEDIDPPPPPTPLPLPSPASHSHIVDALLDSSTIPAVRTATAACRPCRGHPCRHHRWHRCRSRPGGSAHTYHCPETPPVVTDAERNMRATRRLKYMQPAKNKLDLRPTSTVALGIHFGGPIIDPRNWRTFYRTSC